MNADSDREITYLVTEIPERPGSFAAEVHQLILAQVKVRVLSLVPGTELPALEALEAAAIPLTLVPRITGPTAACAAPPGVGRLAALSALHLRLLTRRARSYLATLASVAAMSWKSRSDPSSCRKELLEDFLLAVEIAVRLLDAGTAQHVHGYEGHRTSTRAWLASRITGSSFSFTAGASPVPGSGLERTLLEQKLMASRFVVTRSDAARKRLTRAFPEAGVIHTVYHGLDTRYFSPQVEPRQPSTPVVLAVGRFEENSGFEYLIAACAQLKAAGTPCCCWLVGPEGAQSGALLRAIETHDVSDRVSTHGGVTPMQLRHLLRHASVFALPRVHLSDLEYFPEGLAEAMATGIPVVSTGVGIIPEVLQHKRNAVTLANRDSRALARVLQALLDSAPLRHRLGQSGRHTARQAFDIRVTAAMLKTLFHTFVPGATATPDTAGDGLAPASRLRPLMEMLSSSCARLLRTSSEAHANGTPSRAMPVE